jgi:hypothetical protein
MLWKAEAMRELPPDVRAATQRHLDAVDAVAPGLIQALYVTGSVALGDYQPGRSDIDFMAFTSRQLNSGDVEVLREVHARLSGLACYDGNYVGWDERSQVPDDEPTRVHIVAGEFKVNDCHELTPSTWTEFSRYAIAVRGPDVAELGVSIPRSRLSAWNLGNLNGYWSNLAETAARILAERDPAGTARAEAVAWGALGPPRLHYTLDTGDITSKSGAGRHALEYFPEYSDLIRAAMAWRATGEGEFSNATALHGTDFIRAVVADANQRWGA